MQSGYSQNGSGISTGKSCLVTRSCVLRCLQKAAERGLREICLFVMGIISYGVSFVCMPPGSKAGKEGTLVG